jgi:hypothetical protein
VENTQFISWSLEGWEDVYVTACPQETCLFGNKQTLLPSSLLLSLDLAPCQEFFHSLHDERPIDLVTMVISLSD